MDRSSRNRNPPLSGLVAARLRPQRRPPPAAHSDREAFFLRISRPDENAPESSPLPSADAPAAQVLRQLAGLGESLLAAQRFLRRMSSHLSEARERVAQLREAAHKPDAARAALHTRLQAALDAVELIAHTAQSDERHLLDGSWTAPWPASDAGIDAPIRLPSCRLNDLGDHKVGRLGQLRRKIAPNLAEAIIRSAQNQLARHVQAIESYLQDALLPAIRQWQIVHEAQLAARAARCEPDFLGQVSALTPAHALACGPAGSKTASDHRRLTR